MAKTKAQPEFEPAEADDNIGLATARAILWAAEHLNDKVTQKSAPVPLAYNYWKHGKKYPTKLLVELVPKALSIIDKNKAASESADVQAAEKRSIADLEELLAGALEDAGLAEIGSQRAAPKSVAAVKAEVAQIQDELSEVGF